MKIIPHLNRAVGHGLHTGHRWWVIGDRQELLTKKKKTLSSPLRGEDEGEGDKYWRLGFNP
jgi:hypothetical protein